MAEVREIASKTTISAFEYIDRLLESKAKELMGARQGARPEIPLRVANEIVQLAPQVNNSHEIIVGIKDSIQQLIERLQRIQEENDAAVEAIGDEAVRRRLLAIKTLMREKELADFNNLIQ